MWRQIKIAVVLRGFIYCKVNTLYNYRDKNPNNQTVPYEQPLTTVGRKNKAISYIRFTLHT